MGVKIEGIGELRQNFEKLAIEMRDKISRRMVVAGGQILRKESRVIAQSKGLRKSGALIKNIVIKRERNAPPGIEQVNLGVRHGRAMNGKKVIKYLALNKSGRVVVRRQNDPFYWSFLEFGHKTVARASGKEGVIKTTYSRTTKNGKVRVVVRKVQADAISIRRRSPTGFVEATPFIAPALVNKRTEAIQAMGDQLKKDLDKLAAS